MTPVMNKEPEFFADTKKEILQKKYLRRNTEDGILTKKIPKKTECRRKSSANGFSSSLYSFETTRSASERVNEFSRKRYANGESQR